MAQDGPRHGGDGVSGVHEAGAAKKPADPTFTMVMPGSAEKNSREIRAISPEKTPADPKTGPGAMYAFMGAAVVFLAVVSLVSVIWIGWAGAAMALGFGVLALGFNPEIVATFNRAGERRKLLEERAKEEKEKYEV